MKKLILMAVAMMFVALPAANAQKVNTEAELAKLSKVDAACADAKKGSKAATWIARGKAYTDAFIAPTKELGRGVPEQQLVLAGLRPDAAYEGTFLGYPAIVYEFEYVDVYVVNGLIEGWNQKKSIKEDLAQTAIDSYRKAYELDPKQEAKVAEGLSVLANKLVEQGDALNAIERVLDSAAAFELAYEAMSVVPMQQANGDYLYNAGIQYTIFASTVSDPVEAAKYFAKGEEILSKAIATGYADTDGTIYYYLFHCYYGQKCIDKERALAKGKEALLTGIQLFPKNVTILDGLMQFYTAEEGVGDPAELIDMIEASLAEDPSNYDLWFGRGRVFNALKQYDECINSFKKCAELRPEEFDANYYVAYFIIEKANAAIDELNANSANMGYEEYDARNQEINLIYAESLPWLEKAYAINPEDMGAIEYLKIITFRLRDMDGMMDKYNTYKAIYDARVQ